MARRVRLASGAATLAAAVCVLLILALDRRPNLAHEEDEGPGTVRRIPVVESAVQLRIELGRQDRQQRVWEGEVSTSEGTVLGVEVLRGAVNSTAEGARFQVRARRAGQAQRPRQRPNLLSAILQVSLDAPATATVTVKTSHGEFTFRPADLEAGKAVAYLEGAASVEREAPSLKLTAPNTEDDYPAVARDRDGTLWLAYVEYKPGSPIIMPQVANRRFDSLEPEGNGDQIQLGWFDGDEWRLGVDVTEPGRDIYRPTVAVDAAGNIVVAWAEKIENDWDVYFRTYAKPAAGQTDRQWSEVRRIEHAGGSDFNVVSTVDSSGRVWLAWQSWAGDNFDIRVAGIDGGEEEELIGVANSEANEWCPAIAADSKGGIYVAWDTYEHGNYDVRLQQFGRETRDAIQVADSPRFEARPHVACDAADRVLIAYEEGDVSWGKDYQGNTPERVGIGENPGNGLYVNRTVRVKCLADGSLQQPGSDLSAAFEDSTLQRNKSIPRLVVDGAGGVWLAFRHHPLSGGNGEAWHSYAVRFEGDGWSEPRHVPNSSNLMDHKPALAADGDGIMVVYATDRRTRTQDRDQSDLYVTRLAPLGDVAQPQLESVSEADIVEPEPVHPREAEDVARLRAARVMSNGKELRLLRGEFHRHTEYSAHRDGDGTLEDSLRYGLDAGRLDWMGNGDHDNGAGHEYMWWQIQKLFDLCHNPPYFTGAMTYERSVRYPSGHRNVMLPRRGIRPLPRLSNQEPILYGTPEEGSPDIKLLYDFLKHFDGMCSSHTSGTNMGTDWRDNNPEVEPVVEIYQGHRHSYERPGSPRSATEQTQIGGFEPAGSIHLALLKGYQLGFQSSSDHVSTHISYGIILAEDNSREAIIDAFKQRHSYAATDNILLVVRSGDHLLGDKFETASRPRLEIQIRGTAPIARLYVVRSDQYVFTAEPNEQEVQLTYTDMDVRPGESHYYYVRAEQSDGNLAWGSPMWITYKP